MSSKYNQPSYTPDYNDNFRESNNNMQVKYPTNNQYSSNIPTQSFKQPNIQYNPSVNDMSSNNSYQPQQYSSPQYTRPVENQYINQRPLPPQYNNFDLYSNQINVDNPNKFNWIKFGKNVVIYTILFLIMSHLKMNDFLCSFIPLLNNNEILCMTVKGIVMSLIIIVIQKIL
jgi:hypothetical protein